jgi:hypothetical protein
MVPYLRSTALLVCLLPCGCVNRPGTEITERDYKTRSEQLAFVQQFFPAAIPQGAHNIRFTLVDWMDYNFDGSFELDKKDFAAFASAMRSSGKVDGRRITFDVPDPVGGKGEVTLDEHTGIVVIECTSTRPKSEAP